MKDYIRIFLLITCIVLPIQASADVAETVTVEVQGLGKDVESAQKNALYLAVEKAVGAYVDNEVVVMNEEVIRDKVLTVAQGFVQSFDILSPPKERRDGSGLWEVKIKAVVKKSEVGAALRSAGVISVSADGSAAWATLITRLKSREDAMGLIEKVIGAIPRNLVVCSMINDKQGLQIEENPKTGNQLVILKARVEINYDWWTKEAIPALKAAFNQLKLQQTESEKYKYPIETKVLNYNGNVHSYADGSLSIESKSDLVINELGNVIIFDRIRNQLTPSQGIQIHLLEIFNKKNNYFEISVYDIPFVVAEKIRELIKNVFEDKLVMAYFQFYTTNETPFMEIPIVLERQIDLYHRLLTNFEVASDIFSIAPILQQRADFGHGRPGTVGGARIIKAFSFNYVLKFEASGDVLKQTRRIGLKAGAFGIKTLQN